jgi:hypothetical protein
MTTTSPPQHHLFSWFDRAILGAIFIGLVLVGIGVIHALNAAVESIEVSKGVVKVTDKILNATFENTELTIQNQKLIFEILEEIRNITANNPQTTLEEQQRSFQMTEDILGILNSTNATKTGR